MTQDIVKQFRLVNVLALDDCVSSFDEGKGRYVFDCGLSLSGELVDQSDKEVVEKAAEILRQAHQLHHQQQHQPKGGSWTLVMDADYNEATGRTRINSAWCDCPCFPYGMRRFKLNRKEDETGVSGIGIIAQGIELEDGIVVLKWLTERRSTAIYQSMADVQMIHGYQGKTVVEWID